MDDHLKLVISRGGKATPLELSLSPSATIQELKEAVQGATGISPSLMKLLFKGSQLKEPSMTLGDAKLKSGSKIILMASQTEDIAKVAAGALVSSLLPTQTEALAVAKEPLSEATVLLTQKLYILSSHLCRNRFNRNIRKSFQRARFPTRSQEFLGPATLFPNVASLDSTMPTDTRLD